MKYPYIFNLAYYVLFRTCKLRSRRCCWVHAFRALLYLVRSSRMHWCCEPAFAQAAADAALDALQRYLRDHHLPGTNYDHVMRVRVFAHWYTTHTHTDARTYVPHLFIPNINARTHARTHTYMHSWYGRILCSARGGRCDLRALRVRNWCARTSSCGCVRLRICAHTICTCSGYVCVRVCGDKCFLLSTKAHDLNAVDCTTNPPSPRGWRRIFSGTPGTDEGRTFPRART